MVPNKKSSRPLRLIKTKKIKKVEKSAFKEEPRKTPESLNQTQPEEPQNPDRFNQPCWRPGEEYYGT